MRLSPAIIWELVFDDEMPHKYRIAHGGAMAPITQVNRVKVCRRVNCQTDSDGRSGCCAGYYYGLRHLNGTSLFSDRISPNS